MTDKQLIAKIIKFIKAAKFKEVAELGINAQTAQKVRRGEPVNFRQKTLDRLRKKFDKGEL